MKTRMLVDMSSLCWTYLLKGTDTEHGRVVQHEGKEVRVNSATFCYENAVTFLVDTMTQFNVVPYDLILVIEGKSSKSRRQAMCPDYKSKRDSRPPEAYDAFNTAKEMIASAFRDVGATTMVQDTAEGDDVIAFLCQKLAGKKIIVSNDNDLCRLVTADVIQYRMGTTVRAGDNPKGPFPTKYITLEKALVGGHDDLKGAVGFGSKAWLDLLVWVPNYTALDALEGMVRRKKLHELADDVASFKPFQKLINSAETVYQSYAASLLHPEWVNTLRHPLQITAGMTKKLDQVQDERLRRWAQKTKLITADNYDEAIKFLKSRLAETPEFALDIESSTSDESDEWLSAGSRDDKVDVFGQELTSGSITFGANGQFTYFFSVDHADTRNITSEQFRQAVALIPSDKVTLVQNAGFELSVLYQEWADKQADNGQYGFLPNVRDTKVYASYVNENIKLGLKDRSKHHLGYEQVSYAEVTTLTGQESELPKGGKLLNRETEFMLLGHAQKEVEDENGMIQIVDVPVYSDEATETGVVTKQYKMRELSGQHVLAYGADDTICTYALAQHYRIVMEIEGTWDLCEEIETYPAYLTALGFLKGTKFDLQQMLEQEREDQVVWERAWATLRDQLIAKGWEGTVCPQIVTEVTEHWHREWNAKTIKEITPIILDGVELATMVRTPAKLGRLIAELDHDDAPLLGKYVEDGNIEQVNDLLKARFNGEPKLDMDSPKTMQKFLYDFLKLPVRIINPLSDGERAKAYNRPAPGRKPYTQEELRQGEALASAVQRFNKIRAGSNSEPPLTDGELALVRLKAKTDDTAIDFALYFDRPEDPVLTAIKTLKTIETRQKLFYRPYRHFLHWKDNKIHASANQCQAVTRRWSFNDPNLTQLPKKGEGVKFRRNFKPHHKDAVMVSVDFASQELRLQAGLSGDQEMLSCYLGDRPRDIHCITSSSAMRIVWKADEIAQAVASLGIPDDVDDYELFMSIYKGKDAVFAKKAKDLRGLCKNVNFGSSYGCAAPKMQELLVCEFETAETLLNAKLEKFNRYEEWKKEVEEQAMVDGFIRTELGGIRHLQDVVRRGEKWELISAARQASNFKIQSAGAELAKKALTKLWKSGVFFRLDAVFFAVIHDEVVASVHKDHAVEFLKILHDAISQPYTPDFPVPFVGSISLGPSLGDQIELGEVVDEGLIEATIAQMFGSVEAGGKSKRLIDWTESLRMPFNDVLSRLERGTPLKDQIEAMLNKEVAA